MDRIFGRKPIAGRRKQLSRIFTVDRAGWFGDKFFCSLVGRYIESVLNWRGGDEYDVLRLAATICNYLAPQSNTSLAGDYASGVLI